MSDTSNTGTGSGNNSNTSKWGWSGSTLGSASGGPRSGNPFNPLPGGKFGNSMPGDKTGRGTKLALGAGAAGLLILANNANTTIEATPFAGFTPGRPETGVEAAKERYGGDGGNIKPAPEVSKINTTDIKLPNEESEAELARLFLMDIGGRELITLTRHDQIAGINQEYSPIKNLSNIALEYNPLAISPNADNVSTYLTLFNFDITKYVPTQQELNEEYPLEENASKRSVVYFDKTTNSLIVHVKNTFTNERIEVEFIIPEGVKDGTIYT
jgi:hypothetical protein